jgi:voltage-gated potassium channel
MSNQPSRLLGRGKDVRNTNGQGMEQVMNNLIHRHESGLGMFQFAVLILTVVNLIALLADLLVPLPREISALIHYFDTAVCVVLLTDFLVRLYQAPDKVAFLKWGWIDLVASIPDLEILRWGRLVRVLRVIRIVRAVRSFQKVLEPFLRRRTETGAVSLGLVSFLLVTSASIAMLACERETDSNIKSAGDALWWCLSTISTVGYGDKYPVTPEGRMVAAVVMMSGVGLFGGLSGLLASVFVGAHKREEGDIREVLARLDQLQAQIEALRTQKPGNSLRPGE